MANIEKLREEVDFVAFNPEKHNQKHWFKENDSECGTTGCLAGWTVAHEKDKLEFINKESWHEPAGYHYVKSTESGYEILIRDAAASVLGLTEDQAHYFFHEHRTIEDFYMGIKILEENPDATEAELYSAIGYDYDWFRDEYFLVDEVSLGEWADEDE